jgi:penicillin-binding protein 1A
MNRLLKLSIQALWLLLSLGAISAVFALTLFIYLESHLPDVDSLRNVKLQVPLRIYTADQKLIAEFGEKRRIPITQAEIPPLLTKALLATEDQRFFEHPGVDILGLARAALQLLRTGEKSQGGSTITMQVARNFFLNRKKTYIRKLNEILLAIEIDRKLTKDKILELYFNKIYMGNRAYGVAAAAQVYYGKTLAELNLSQIAMLAGLPKAPSYLNPLINPKAALKRRNHVLTRMLEQNYIDKLTYEQARVMPLSAAYHGPKTVVNAPHVAEMVRLFMIKNFDKEAYTNGYQVYTTIQSKLQPVANVTLTNALFNFDQRHGYRGPQLHLDVLPSINRQQWLEKLAELPRVQDTQAAAILYCTEQAIHLLNQDEQIITLDWDQQRLVPALKNGSATVPIKDPTDYFKPGDVVYLKSVGDNYQITQLPEIEGALISLNPKDGAIVALVGGFNFEQSNYNRATQAARQPGSSFKPFVYSAALSKGFTLASIINDAPVVLDDPSQENLWRPQNHNHKFYGPTNLRTGLTRSRNLVSIRLLDSVGIPYAIKHLTQFGFNEKNLPQSLSLALGSLDITPLELATAYAVLANGGFKVEPYLIHHIRDSNSETLFKSKPIIACPRCEKNPNHALGMDPEQQAPRVISQQVAYLMNNVLQDVIQRGTGRAAKVLKRHDIAGKTGTTNDQVDAWFAGYNQDYVTVTWAGYDKPRSLHEYASKIALPMWIAFMKVALDGLPEKTLPEPPGLVTVRIDPSTGLLAPANSKNARFEIFRQENAPHQYSRKTDKSTLAANDTELEQLF